MIIKIDKTSPNIDELNKIQNITINGKLLSLILKLCGITITDLSSNCYYKFRIKVEKNEEDEERKEEEHKGAGKSKGLTDMPPEIVYMVLDKLKDTEDKHEFMRTNKKFSEFEFIKDSCPIKLFNESLKFIFKKLKCKNVYVNKYLTEDELEILKNNKVKNIKIKDISNISKLNIFPDYPELETLEFIFNQPIDDFFSSFPKSVRLTHITFYEDFNQSIDNLRHLNYLTHLTFHHEINRPINILPINLTHLILKFFDQPIDNLQSNSLTYLDFGFIFNQPIVGLKNLPNLTYLDLGRNFNQPIEDLQYLSNLTHLYFSSNFNQPIVCLKYLPKLTYLSFATSNHFNQTINYLPPSLISLELSSAFNQPIDVNLPNMTNLQYINNQFLTNFNKFKSLRTIRFGNDFNQSIDTLSELSLLTSIYFGNNFNRSLYKLSTFHSLYTIYS